MLETLVYVSSAAPGFRTEELANIIAAGRRNNARNGVTGLLLYAEGSFLQALEGGPEALAATMGRIRRDPRHQGILEIYRAPISQRSFPGSAMGCRAAAAETEGAFTLTRENLRKHIDPGSGREVLSLLQQFYASAFRFEGV